MSNKLHHFDRKGRDQVTGELGTRCGLKGHIDRRALPREPGETWALLGKERYLVTGSEHLITCPACTIKTTANERRALRALFDRPRPVRDGDSIQVGDNAVYLPRAVRTKLAPLLFVKLRSDEGHIAPGARELVSRFPAPTDPFKKPRKRKPA